MGSRRRDLVELVETGRRVIIHPDSPEADPDNYHEEPQGVPVAPEARQGKYEPTHARLAQARRALREPK